MDSNGYFPFYIFIHTTMGETPRQRCYLLETSVSAGNHQMIEVVIYQCSATEKYFQCSMHCQQRERKMTCRKRGTYISDRGRHFAYTKNKSPSHLTQIIESRTLVVRKKFSKNVIINELKWYISKRYRCKQVENRQSLYYGREKGNESIISKSYFSVWISRYTRNQRIKVLLCPSDEFKLAQNGFKGNEHNAELQRTDGKMQGPYCPTKCPRLIFIIYYSHRFSWEKTH